MTPTAEHPTPSINNGPTPPDGRGVIKKIIRKTSEMISVKVAPFAKIERTLKTEEHIES